MPQIRPGWSLAQGSVLPAFLKQVLQATTSLTGMA